MELVTSPFVLLLLLQISYFGVNPEEDLLGLNALVSSLFPSLLSFLSICFVLSLPLLCSPQAQCLPLSQAASRQNPLKLTAGSRAGDEQPDHPGLAGRCAAWWSPWEEPSGLDASAGPEPAAPELSAAGPFPKPDPMPSIHIEFCIFCWDLLGAAALPARTRPCRTPCLGSSVPTVLLPLLSPSIPGWLLHGGLFMDPYRKLEHQHQRAYDSSLVPAWCAVLACPCFVPWLGPLPLALTCHYIFLLLLTQACQAGPQVCAAFSHGPFKGAMV